MEIMRFNNLVSEGLSSDEPPFTIKSKLFSFMQSVPIPKKQKTCSEELEAYLRKVIFV